MAAAALVLRDEQAAAPGVAVDARTLALAFVARRERERGGERGRRRPGSRENPPSMERPRTFTPFRVALVGLAAVAGTATIGALGAWAFVASGVYDIGATDSHTQPVYTLLKVAGVQSIRRQARGIAAPRLDDAALVARGGACYRDKCLVCHGGPGVAQGDVGRSMQPLPGPLVDAAYLFNARELYWVVKNGIKMSGMPAWEYRMADADLWATVAFLQRMPGLDARRFRDAMAPTQPPCDAPRDAATASTTATAATPTATATRRAAAPVAATAPTAASVADAASAPADPARGKVALTQYACNACHLIPGVAGARVHVGPPLAGLATRAVIAGKLPNTPANVAAWIVDPQRFDAQTAMPRLDVAERDARDIAAYLATLH